ncbi:MAG TPA: PKD domain-containing protein [Methanoregulaceae archaeon]|nr:MAG: PKD domain-containing protein [Methanolinea sp.]HON81316.1 PKD domain-containing protein [Methanoregulaceae archaeon]HPD09820.1 PKD domain-containing protein [Methanoregulaceae archaeon]HRT14459.1 PKD domain-containing protein [Methanoregulaceae archaeon]HRU30030.1 PKD domain-containing protein [Methanoregulaceae archaeon]
MAVISPPPTTVPTPVPTGTTADFTASPLSGNAPLTVQFTDLSSGNPAGWTWLFGDGATSSGQNPVHVYQNPGVYTVTLRVSYGPGSYKVQKPGYITVT